MPSSTAAQTPPTPTPNAAGEIIIIVQPDDTPLAIAATYGITIEELYQLNNLTEDSLIFVGQQLIVGFVPPTATPTPVPPTLTPSPTLPPPPTGTAVVRRPTGLCLIAYEDINGDGIHQAGEPAKANVAFTIFTEQSVILNYITDGFSEPRCFENMAPGTYQITRSVATGERLTTPGNRGIIIQADTLADLQFGSTIDDEVEIISEFDATTEVPTVLPLGAAIEENGTAPEQRSRNFVSRQLIIIGLLAMLLVMALFFIIMRLKK